jgi:RNA polymerase sigma factor (sigma-70 family)
MAGVFPPTRITAITRLQSDDPAEQRRSLDWVAWAYYKPIYKHLRVRWRASPEDAEDMTHDFFARAVERGIFRRFDPERGRFRTFLRTCIDNFFRNTREAEQRMKRGGAERRVSLDAEQAERELGLAAEGVDPETIFDREWARNVAARSVELLEKRLVALDRRRAFEVFRRYDLHDGPGEPTYASIAAELGVTTSDVSNQLHAARRELRNIVLGVLREITASEDDYRGEARELLGIEP